MKQPKREHEGFHHSVNTPEGQVPCCSTYVQAFHCSLADHRGWVPGTCPPHLKRTAVEWETSPAQAEETTVFTWIGGSLVRPAMRKAFPYVSASLFVNDIERLTFPLGFMQGYTVSQEGFSLSFEPHRFQSLVEATHRVWEPSGISGFYRLTVPEEYLQKGQSLRLRVQLPSPQPDRECFFYVSPRQDALQEDLAALRSEVAMLQTDLVQLRLSHEMLYAQVYPQLFPEQIKGERFIALQDPTLHFHPASVTALRNGDVIVTVREAQDHLDRNGRIVMVRSGDGGCSWSQKQLLYDVGQSDHRCAPIFELPNGDWVTTDFRAGCFYHADGTYWHERIEGAASLWGAWSTDCGATWHFTDRPITVPNATSEYVEPERHMIQLPSGRLMFAASHYNAVPETHAPDGYYVGVFYSDDNGCHWEYLSSVPYSPYMTIEPSIIRTKTGKLLIMARSEATFGEDWERRGPLYQSVSLDEGKSWSEFQPTRMSSMSSPCHLLLLQDGRILCTHASRFYPGSIYATLSYDDGITWDADNTRVITHDLQNTDSCYPTSAQLADGTMITVWYANLFGKFYVGGLRYRSEEL